MHLIERTRVHSLACNQSLSFSLLQLTIVTQQQKLSFASHFASLRKYVIRIRFAFRLWRHHSPNNSPPFVVPSFGQFCIWLCCCFIAAFICHFWWTIRLFHVLFLFLFLLLFAALCINFIFFSTLIVHFFCILYFVFRILFVFISLLIYLRPCVCVCLWVCLCVRY